MLDQTKGMKAFPKIWALGSKWAQGIFDTDVEITEKLDGSQFGFSYPEGKSLVVRSKGAIINQDEPQKLFKPAVGYVLSIQDYLNMDYAYYGEAICSKRHNTLTYNNVPRNHIALFAIYDFCEHRWLTYPEMKEEAERLCVDCVPLLYAGKADPDIVKGLIGKESYLGGPIAEGVVVKAFKDIEIAGVMYPIHSGKYVTEEFKEKHGSNPTFKPGKHNAKTLFEQYNTEARFKKAVQKLSEAGDLQEEPRDIGKLMKILNEDLEEECADEIKDALWKLLRKEFLSTATKGFAEWYKKQLLDKM